jgi:hypothetical protein
MDYSFGLIIISTNLATFLASVCYCNYKFKSVNQVIANNKMVDEILHTKIINLERDLDKMEKFKVKILEKNIVVKENRAWDLVDTDEEDDDEEDDDETF